MCLKNLVKISTFALSPSWNHRTPWSFTGFPPETINNSRSQKHFLIYAKFPTNLIKQIQVPEKPRCLDLNGTAGLLFAALQLFTILHHPLQPHWETPQRRRLVWDPVTAALPCCLSRPPKLLILSQKSLSPLDLIHVMITNSHTFEFLWPSFVQTQATEWT